MILKVFLLSLLLTGQALALDLELAAGRSEFCCVLTGVWWQPQFGFSGSTRSASWEVGARHRWENFSLHAAYLDLGSASGMNVATMRDDDLGTFNTAKGCNTDSQKNCIGYFGASQRVSGVLAGVAANVTVKGVLLEAELGQYFYKSDMRISIWCPNCGVNARYAFGAGGTFASTSSIRRSPYFAVKVGYKNAFVTYRRFSSVDGSGKMSDGIEGQFGMGLTNGPVNQIMVGMSF